MTDEKPQKALGEVTPGNSTPRDWLGRALSFIAIGVASYACLLFYENNLAVEKITLMSREVADIAAVLEQNELILRSDTEEAIASLSKEQAHQLNKLKSNIEKALENRSTHNSSVGNWSIAEVEYLIRMASQRILMDKDPVIAIELLNAADHILEQMDPLTSLSLRDSLASDILSLKTVNQPDFEGIYLGLNAKIQLVDNLAFPRQAFKVEREENAFKKTNLESTSSQVISFWQRFKTSLSQYIDFRKESDVMIPILLPREEYYLRQNLILSLRQAQIALLRRETAVFTASVGDALRWLNQFFQRDEPTTLAMREGLLELRDLDLEYEIPYISASIEEVRKFALTVNSSTR